MSDSTERMREEFEKCWNDEFDEVNPTGASAKISWHMWQCAAELYGRAATSAALDLAIETIHPEDFEEGSSEWCALRGAQTEVRALKPAEERP